MAFPPLALLALLSISAFITVPSAEATFCTILPFLCHVPPPPPISVTLSPPPPIRVTPPPPPPPPISVTPSPPPPPPPPTIGGFSLTTIFISGTLICPITSETQRLILLRNAIVDLRCGSGSTATLLATTVTNNVGNYVISLDINVATSSQFDPNTCVLVITTRGNVCPQAQIPSVALRVLVVERSVGIVTSPLFAN